MRAAVMREGRLVVDDVLDPVPGPGEILVRTIACGICGSDLHALQRPDALELSGDIVMGHEFCAETEDGRRVVSMPIAFGPDGPEAVGYSNRYPGGYGELMVLNEALLLETALDPRMAALTEPMAVGLHAVNRSRIERGERAMVFGCGPIGLAVIAFLARKGIEPIVAADLSPRRREMALAMGAHEIGALNPDGYPCVIFEAVGVPGMLDTIIRDAPRRSRVCVAGVCMDPDTIHPMTAIRKELEMQFVLGYEPDEFADTLRALTEGEVNVDGIVTGIVGIDGIPDAFEALARPDEAVKILVEPS
jgi:threonine dehydrogenase-like Zn-dependent dehydrogenase